MERRRFLQVVAGPRQVGKSTLVQQVVEASGIPARFASGDEPSPRGGVWIQQQWDAARLLAREGDEGAVLVLDEIQKIPNWSETVKRLWDEDTRARWPLKVVLLGAAPLLITRGLTESLAGRFEVLRLPHWAFAEMRDAFGRTLAHYLDLLAGAGMLCGLQKYAGDAARQRGSSPKFQVMNTALRTAPLDLTLDEARGDPEFWGRLVESAVGACLANVAASGECTLHYWRERGRDVDFIVKAGRRLTAIEVKRGRSPVSHPGTAAFVEANRPQRALLVGGDGVALEDFLGRPIEEWIRG